MRRGQLQQLAQLNDELGLPDALEELGVAQLGMGQGEAARASLEEGRARNLALGNRQKAGECTLALGMTAMSGASSMRREPDSRKRW